MGKEIFYVFYCSSQTNLLRIYMYALWKICTHTERQHLKWYHLRKIKREQNNQPLLSFKLFLYNYGMYSDLFLDCPVRSYNACYKSANNTFYDVPDNNHLFIPKQFHSLWLVTFVLFKKGQSMLWVVKATLQSNFLPCPVICIACLASCISCTNSPTLLSFIQSRTFLSM